MHWPWECNHSSRDSRRRRTDDLVFDRVDRTAINRSPPIRATFGLGHLLLERLALDGAQSLLGLVRIAAVHSRCVHV